MGREFMMPQHGDEGYTSRAPAGGEAMEGGVYIVCGKCGGTYRTDPPGDCPCGEQSRKEAEHMEKLRRRVLDGPDSPGVL